MSGGGRPHRVHVLQSCAPYKEVCATTSTRGDYVRQERPGARCLGVSGLHSSRMSRPGVRCPPPLVELDEDSDDDDSDDSDDELAPEGIVGDSEALPDSETALNDTAGVVFGVWTITHLRMLFNGLWDFKAQKSRIAEVVEARGHICMFLPKFHCELNYIELYWCLAK